MSAWLPIESAPRDGTVILACQIGMTAEALMDQPIAVLQWREDVPLPGWIGSTSLGLVMRHPTHWMPLPEAPSPVSPNGEVRS